YRCGSTSSSDMPPTVDDNRFPGQVVGFENEEHCPRDVFGASFASERCRATKPRGVLFAPALRQQYGARRGGRDAHLRREYRGERSREIDDTRLRNAVRDVAGPRL